ncbi:hypothetical protein [Actinomadura rupiterrae]|uniref:hypothetical protein n=1 Tax=Actinomadura rupiterrae TaxID=559627 RepID=UPI0020A37041|nr:hypothetical protein [Actinomadura rupiterrae]MCP2334739.1 hypothetical protein [Actinomadura rupiterrae]
MDPITIAVVTAAAGKAVELAGDPVKNGAKQLYALLRGRLKDDAELAQIEQTPDGPEKAAVLEGVIRRAADADPEIRRQAEALEALIRQAMDANAEFRRELDALRAAALQESERETYSNTFNGNANNVVQINEIRNATWNFNV